jgi:4-hydroxy-3-methylbut-2-enyl diphosphate reductase
MKGLTVEIDPHSGFCGGVIRAIGQAEAFLSSGGGGKLWSLGQIVHNEAELKRLEDEGLRTVSLEELGNLPKDATLLIRAHGEPPETYSRLNSLGIKVIDCTCPVVLRLQKSIREAWARVRPEGGNVVIFGKIGHAEVLGLVGQTDGEAVVVESLAMLKGAISRGRISLDAPVEIFSQTTKSPMEYEEICRFMESSMQGRGHLEIHKTICRQVASRHSELSGFASSHDVVIFVSGSGSSNGKVLCDLCRSVNPRTFHVTDPSGLNPGWFKDGDKVGVCGATSAPKWLLEAVADAIATGK